MVCRKSQFHIVIIYDQRDIIHKMSEACKPAQHVNIQWKGDKGHNGAESKYTGRDLGVMAVLNGHHGHHGCSRTSCGSKK